MGVFRILLGFANLASLALLFPTFNAWFSESGFTPLALTQRADPPIARDFYLGGWKLELPFTVPNVGVFNSISNYHVLLVCLVILMVAAVLTTLGLWTRVSSIILAIGVVSLQHRNTLILHGGDTVVRLGAIYIAMAPSGKACSVDRLIGLWRGRIKPGPVWVSAWPQRLMAFNCALVYFTTWWSKLEGDKWRSGSAAWFPAHLNEFHRFWVPSFLYSGWMVPILTFGTLATELALGTIVFWRPARKWVLLAGLLMHAWIEYSMNIPLFALSICSFYVAFYEGAEISAWAARIGKRLSRFNMTAPKFDVVDDGAAAAIRATDTFSLVSYTEQSSGASSGDLARQIWTRSPGAWILGIVPGLWRRMFNQAFRLRATE